MRNTYRDEVEAALGRVRELEEKLSLRETELLELEQTAIGDQAMLARFERLAASTRKASRASRWSLVGGAAIGCAGILIGVLTQRSARAMALKRSAESRQASPVASTAPFVSEQPTRPERTSLDAQQAIAIPNNGSGWLDVIIADHAISCATRNDPSRKEGSCPSSWRLRLSLPPDHRDPGVHQAGSGRPVFAYVDRQRPVKYEGPGAGEVCLRNGGGDVTGTVEVVSASATEVVLRLDTDEFVGTVKASVCGSCQSTGMACTTNADCCTQFCGGGHCHP